MSNIYSEDLQILLKNPKIHNCFINYDYMCAVTHCETISIYRVISFLWTKLFFLQLNR